MLKVAALVILLIIISIAVTLLTCQLLLYEPTRGEKYAFPLEYKETYSHFRWARVAILTVNEEPNLLMAVKGLISEGYTVNEAAAVVYRDFHLDRGMSPDLQPCLKYIDARYVFVNAWGEPYTLAFVDGRISLLPPTAAAVPGLIKALKTQDCYIRLHAARTLSRMGPVAKPAIPALIASLKDEYRQVVVWAALALIKLGRADKGLPHLVQALEDNFRYVRLEAAGSLRALGPAEKDAIPVLTEALEHKDEDVCRAAAEALGNIGPAAKEAVPALEAAIKEPDGWARYAAAEALVKLGVPERALSVLIAALEEQPSYFEEKASYLRECLARTLGEIGAPAKAAIPALTKALKDKKADVRKAAAEALGKIAPAAKEAVPALEAALEDKDKWVRYAAVGALVKLGVLDRALPVLIEAVEDDSWLHRLWAATTLGEIGAPAKAGSPALEKALKDANAIVRTAAAEALRKIQQEQPTTASTRPAKGS